MHTSSAPDISVQQFPILGRTLYVNHAAISPWPRVTAEAVSEFAMENCLEGSMNYPDWLRRESRLRKNVAELLHADSGDDVALLKNTTEGIACVANGIDWRAGDNIVTPYGEFPSNREAWLALSMKGVELRCVDIRAAEDAESALLEAMDERTRVLTVSAVQWQDGFRLNLERLGRACRSADILFFVDAIQQFGALQLDVKQCAIDVLSAGSHKWQMGPEGMGVFYCRAVIREKFSLTQLGWRMADEPYQFSDRGIVPSSSARRFEGGSPNTLGQVALSASLGLLADVGLPEVERRVLSNSSHLQAGILAIPALQLTSHTGAAGQSGIVCFSHANLTPTMLLQRLRRADVIAAKRGEAIRLSPHFYQGRDCMDELLNRIETVIR